MSEGISPGQPLHLSRELGHGSEDMVRRVYAHLGDVRHRSEVVEFRLEQHLDQLGDRLQRLGLTAPSVTGNVTAGERRLETNSPAGREATAGDEVSGERATGLEPATSSLGSWHSTN